ncbi:MAG: hypothetical protein KAJ01_03970, partial [Candidatus Hydrogenedentes bacterium]|nr:hypothetical protein [Candidatus Hydrogenedentota bacterium]
MKKLVPVIIIVALLLVVAGVAIRVYAKRGSKNNPSGPPMQLAVTVQVAQVERGLIRKTVRYVGSVEAYDSVTVLPKVTGILESMEVDIGDFVS